MVTSGIKAKKVFAGPGSFAWIAEAVVCNEEDEVYVTVQSYDGEEYTVQKESLYDFLAENGKEPEGEFLEEYMTYKEAKGSAYVGVFDQLRKVIKMLG